MDILGAAEKVLRKAGCPLGVDELTRRMVDSGLWIPKSKTPSASVGSAIYVHIKNGGKTFIKTGRATFALVGKRTKKNVTADSGYVYILTNPSFRKDWVKIGMTERPVNIRSKELDNTAVPLPFEIYATLRTKHRRKVENLLHGMIDDLDPNRRIRKSREFFNINPETALRLLIRAADVFDEKENISRELNKPTTAAQPKKEVKPVTQAVIKPKQKRSRPKAQAWTLVTQLAKIIAERGGNAGSHGHVYLTLARKRRCPVSSKWRPVLESVGLKFDATDYVVDWTAAKNPL